MARRQCVRHNRREALRLKCFPPGRVYNQCGLQASAVDRPGKHTIENECNISSVSDREAYPIGT
eukprot:scaffold1018_cov420-Prasinococcus_capsulatus_cf.AAC.5